MRDHAGIAPPEIGFVFGKSDFVLLRFGGDRVMPGGPDRAAAHIANVDKAAPVIARGVFAPARDRERPTG